MALVLQKSVFLHIPKCGGTWGLTAIKKSVARYVDVRGVRYEHGHVGRLGLDLKDYKTFTFVRHPVTWYQSFWAYKVRKGWNPGDLPISRIQATTFPEFIERLLETYPGFLSQYFDTFIGQGVDYVGRQENLLEDLVRILYAIGEKFDERVLRSVPKENVSEALPEYGEGQVQRLMEAEMNLLTRFEYEVR